MADTTAAVVLAMSALGIFILVVRRQWQRSEGRLGGIERTRSRGRGASPPVGYRRGGER
jgi:hypothetical protein